MIDDEDTELVGPHRWRAYPRGRRRTLSFVLSVFSFCLLTLVSTSGGHAVVFRSSTDAADIESNPIRPSLST